MAQFFLSGSITALLTPMKEDGAVDKAAFKRFIEWQVSEGIHALCAAGTTGESPTLSHEEHYDVVDQVVEVVNGRCPVIAGAGSNSTHEAIGFAKHAEKSKASAILVAAPYYNKPTQEGLYRHYMSVADCVDLPVIIYNIPGRSVVDISVETMARLAKHPNIKAVKDSTGDLFRPLLLKDAIDKPFNQISGEDGTAVAFLGAGGDGCISVTANIAPAQCAAIQEAWQKGETKKAIELQQKLAPVHSALFCETSPVPVKYAASLLGLSSPTCRLPLAPLSEESKFKVKQALIKSEILTP